MAHRSPRQSEHGRHPTEVFEDEMAELETSTVRSWSSWVAGIGAFALLAGIVLMVMAHETRTYRAPTVVGNLAGIRLSAPVGPLDHLPAQFVWEPVTGATSYLLTVLHAATEDVVLLRPSGRTSLSPTAEDLARFGPGRYRWTVEARGADGRTRAFGEGEFELSESED